MLTISVWNPKGGVGKSTLALNLSAAVQAKGKNVILADLDPQGTALAIASDGNLPFEVADKIPRNGFDVVIVDHPPGFSEVPTSQAVVFPMRPSRPDMQAGVKALRSLMASGVKVVVVFNDVKRQHRVERQTMQRAVKMKLFAEPKIVKSRTAYRIAMDQGRTIFDDELNGAYAVQDARQEIQNVLKR